MSRDAIWRISGKGPHSIGNVTFGEKIYPKEATMYRQHCKAQGTSRASSYTYYLYYNQGQSIIGRVIYVRRVKCKTENLMMTHSERE